MKKCLCFILAFVCLISASFAEFDFSKMSDKELEDLVNSASAELVKRKSNMDQEFPYLIDDPEGFSIYLTGNGKMDNYGIAYDLELVIINNTDYEQTVNFDNIRINGWETDANYAGYISDIGAGMKKTSRVGLVIKDAKISSYMEIREVELVFHTFIKEVGSNIITKRYGPIGLHFDGINWTIE